MDFFGYGNIIANTDRKGKQMTCNFVQKYANICRNGVFCTNKRAQNGRVEAFWRAKHGVFRGESGNVGGRGIDAAAKSG